MCPGLLKQSRVILVCLMLSEGDFGGLEFSKPLRCHPNQLSLTEVGRCVYINNYQISGVSAPKRQAHKLIWGIKGHIGFIYANRAGFWREVGTSG